MTKPKPEETQIVLSIDELTYKMIGLLCQTFGENKKLMCERLFIDTINHLYTKTRREEFLNANHNKIQREEKCQTE